MLVVHGRKSIDDIKYLRVTALEWHIDTRVFRQLQGSEVDKKDAVGDEIPTMPIPQDWLVKDPYSESPYYTNEDDFEIPLRYVAAGSLRRLRLLTPVPENLAILAYLKEITEPTPVILYWHP